MPIRQNTYIVCFPAEKKSFVLPAFFIVAAGSASALLFGTLQNRLTLSMVLLILVIFLPLFGFLICPNRSPARILVADDGFTVLKSGRAPKTWRFEEITRVCCFCADFKGTQGYRPNGTFWKIYAGDVLAASFSLEMENGVRFYNQLDRLGKIENRH